MSSRPSSQHSALASLTATYTDSEEEAEAEAEDAAYLLSLKTNNSTAQIIEPPSEMSVSGDPGESQEKSEIGGSSSKSQSASASGLVSYQDDLIDDEAVDDLYATDSAIRGGVNQDTEVEVKQQEKDDDKIKLQNGDISSVSPAIQENVEQEQQQETNGIIVLTSSGKPSRIPPEPPGKCAPELQEKISKLYERKLKTGLDMNLAIQRNKNFRNPSIYEKLIKYCDIDELGSNYPPHVFDPHEWRETSYYDELAKAQKELMERRERERKDRTKVDFVSGTVKKPAPPILEPEPKRKSKWDQRGVMPPLLMSLPAPTAIQPPVVQPPFTNSASGTKSTVINAFGSIKKPKV